MGKLGRLGLAYLALLMLLALTVGASRLDWGVGNAVTSMAIAFAKAAIIGVVFMHLARGDRLVMLTAAIIIVWLVLLFSFPLVDYATR